LIIDQLIGGVPPAAKDNEGVVLALIRGVLYALSESNGQTIWAMRVGIDTSHLPLRVPAASGRPEMVLALSSDTETLTALDIRTGEQLWKYRLGAPCLGQPVIVDLRAYVPTYDGCVHEIELARGQLLGRYDPGQKWGGGGPRQEGTKLVYFPADELCVYVLDVSDRKCQAILYTDHPSGSLRSEPIVISSGGRNQDDEDYLILSQSNGLEAMELRAFALPIAPNAQQLALPAPARVRGWSWFQPYHDPSKIVV